MAESARRPERNETYRVGGVAAIVSLIAGLGTAAVSGNLPLCVMQPSEMPQARVEFLRDLSQHAPAALRFFGADFIFIITYVIVFATLYEVTAGRSRTIALIAIFAGVLGALCDLLENASFITYAWGSMRGADFIEPALPLAYYVTNFKESLLGIGIVMFGAIFPRRTALEWTLSILMILGAPLDALAIAYPNLKQLPTLLFVLALPLMSIYFFSRFRNAE